MFYCVNNEKEAIFPLFFASLLLSGGEYDIIHMKWRRIILLHYFIYLSISIVAILAVLLLIYVNINRHKIFYIGLIGLSISIFIYSFFYSLELISPDAEHALLFIQFQRVGILTLPSFWVIMALEYTNRTKYLNKYTYIALFVFPVIMYIFGLTDNLHHLVYADYSVEIIQGLTISKISFGVLYYVLFIYNNLMILLGNILYVHFFLRNKLYQKRSFVMMISSFVPWLGLWIYTMRVLPIQLDINPYFLGASILLFTIVMFRNNIFDTAVIARHTIVDHISEMVITIDGTNKIIDINKAAELFYHKKKALMMGDSLKDIFPTVVDLIESKIDQRTEILDVEMGAEASKINLRIELTYLPGDCKVLIVKDVTEEVKMIYNLRYYATVDQLTEIYNRSYFLDLATERIHVCKKNKTPIAFVIFDIDHFKAINDQFGHSAGDFILKKVAIICQNLIGPIPLLARYGGDEFIMFFEEKTEEEVMILVEKVRRRMMHSNNILEGENITFECSFGVCYIREVVNDVLDIFIKYADEALYQSKREGNNRTTLESFDTL